MIYVHYMGKPGGTEKLQAKEKVSNSQIYLLRWLFFKHPPQLAKIQANLFLLSI